MINIKAWLIDIFDWKSTTIVNWEKYIINPLKDHQPYTTYEMLETVVQWFFKIIDTSKVSKILWEEDRWWFIAALISYKTKIPFWLTKWNPIWCEWDIWIDFRNMYTHWKMYLNWVEKWDKVIIIEDIIDSWWTIISMVNLLKRNNIEIINIFSVWVKEWLNWLENIYKETWYNVNRLCKFRIENWISKINDFNILIN